MFLLPWRPAYRFSSVASRRLVLGISDIVLCGKLYNIVIREKIYIYSGLGYIILLDHLAFHCLIVFRHRGRISELASCKV